MATVKPTAALSLTYVTANRATRSDVVTAATSLLPRTNVAYHGPTDQERAEDANGRRQSVATKPRGPGPLSLSIPAAKLNRELAVERKLFLDRLHHERRLRAELEQTAATRAQSVVRGHLVRANMKPETSREGERRGGRGGTLKRGSLNAGPTPKPDALVRRQLGQLLRLTDRIARVAASRRARAGNGPFAKKMSVQKAHALVVRLQCFARRYLARKTVHILQTYRREEQEREAVVIIQARLRAHLDRKQLASQANAARNAAATKIQSYVRRRLDQKFVVMIREHLRVACQETEAALKLQKMLRAKIARQRVIQQRMEKASVLVQSAYRGHVSRASIDERRRDRLQSVAKLQATYRGHAVRKKSAASSTAARRIQAMERGRRTRKSIRDSSKAATKLQSLYRGTATRRRTQWRTSKTCASAVELRRQEIEAEVASAVTDHGDLLRHKNQHHRAGPAAADARADARADAAGNGGESLP
ncbi:Abnormal spindle-like microcephaly-associated protein-like [Hondaea fermentalgiana]|uniref:Abnormal spindle-like microcephaly-associated protein-like n=1 Tax=Hondaea fermentalgiana TaxID=2315210 RepID=A0A2R5G7Y4_9STRA|nr:Abnormal spindle-like microcephaly-associated protein-like [Hondaea fermentalgiana]|eukprot:GBG26655.1 Abnormal spindle-like microcephaly-associated protein-like [Hondaea fermentalgiana]